MDVNIRLNPDTDATPIEIKHFAEFSVGDAALNNTDSNLISMHQTLLLDPL